MAGTFLRWREGEKLIFSISESLWVGRGPEDKLICSDDKPPVSGYNGTRYSRYIPEMIRQYQGVQCPVYTCSNRLAMQVFCTVHVLVQSPQKTTELFILNNYTYSYIIKRVFAIAKNNFKIFN